MTAEEIDLFIVRHGLTEANKRGITNGRMDEPLAVEGLDQADRLADRLQYKHIDIIYSSPLQRSVQTASPIARKLGKTINLDDRLIEVGFGEFEGKPHAELTATLGSDMKDLLNKYEFDLTPFGGESSVQVEARVRDFYNELKQNENKTILVVTHGGIVRWLHYIVTGEKIGPSPNAEEILIKFNKA